MKYVKKALPWVGGIVIGVVLVGATNAGAKVAVIIHEVING